MNEMKKQNHNRRSGSIIVRMSLLEFLKEKSDQRWSKLEAFLDLVDKASVQYIPKAVSYTHLTLPTICSV